MENQTPTLTRWPYLLVSALSLLFVGIIYAWSILNVPLAEQYGLEPSDTKMAWNFTILISAFCLGGILSGLIIRKVGAKPILLAAAVSTCLSFVLSSRISGSSILHLYLSYGVLGGIGIGLAYNALISTTNAWFPDRKGLCSGIQMMAFGGSALILGNIADCLIDGENFILGGVAKALHIPVIGWQPTFVAIGIMLGIVLLISAFLQKFPPQDTAFPAPRATKAKQGEAPKETDYATTEMIRRSSFWRFYFFLICLTAIGAAAIGLAPSIARSTGALDEFAIALVSVLAICNGLGRLLAGYLFDTIGRRKAMLVGNAITILAPLTVLLAILMASPSICAIGLGLCGISYGFSPTTSAAFTMEFYGRKNFATNFSIANTILIPASFSATIASLLKTDDAYVFLLPFIVLTGVAVVSLLLNFTIRKP
jgi:OFA family oxalate/formate antiporter-like MFS transporter